MDNEEYFAVFDIIFTASSNAVRTIKKEVNI
jgi:hypothetical protein